MISASLLDFKAVVLSASHQFEAMIGRMDPKALRQAFKGDAVA